MAGLFEGPFWDPDIYQLETTDPVIGGAPNIATLAGIDNVPHQQLARRTQWLKSQLGGFGGTLQLSANTVLTASDIGRQVYVTAAVVVTLPAASAVPAGAALHIMSAVDGVSVVRAGGDTIRGLGPATVTSQTVNARGTLWLVSNGVNQWTAIGGSAQLGASGAFDASLAGTGWQVLPSGLILQWGAAATPTNPTDVVLPMAFPTAILQVFATESGGGLVSFGAAPVSPGTIRIFTSNTASGNARWLALGK